MKRFDTISIVIAVIASIALLIVGVPAHADVYYPVFPTYKVQDPVRQPKHIKVKRLRQVKGSRVVVNNGALWSMGPCEYEDSERCFYDASRRGNKVGTSFVRMYHHTFPYTPSNS
jgi:hypothetical protein